MVEAAERGDQSSPTSRVGFACGGLRVGTGYDKIADIYDIFYEDRLGRAENGVVSAALARGSCKYVYDIGCGNGATARMIGSLGKEMRRYVGTDLSKAMLDKWHMSYKSGRYMKRLRADAGFWGDMGLRMQVEDYEHGRLRVELMHSSFSDPLPEGIAKNFDLVSALWALNYADEATAWFTLTQAARYCGRDGRLVATFCTKSFKESGYVIQHDDEMKFLADETLASRIEAYTPWRVERVRGITGPVSRACRGFGYGLTSFVDGRMSKPHEHTYILLEAKLP